MKSLLSYKSQPDESLSEHLQNVADICKNTIENKSLNIWLDEKIMIDILYLIGLCHDFGKFTTFFQEYINEKDKIRQKRLKNNSETHHGLISAIFTYFVLKEFLKEKELSNPKQYDLIPIIGYLIVKRHHGNLKNLDNELLELRDSETKKNLKIQLESINKDDLEEFYSSVDLNKFHDEFVSICYEIKKYRRSIIRTFKGEESPRIYLLSQLLYSILLNSDKQDASGISAGDEICDIDSGLVDKYRVLKGFDVPQNEMDIIRNNIYKDVVSSIDSLDLNNKIYSLNVPTGTGKTLTSFSFALKLRNKLKEEKGFIPKIIYSLPFLSIIDQNFDVFEDVFKEVKGESPASNILLKHHHLAEIFYSTKDDEFEPLESQFIIEGWNSEIIVTTFYQIFHTLISNKNRALRKFHNIVNSIIILDEVQSIPYKYWLLIRKVISTLSETFNTYFIFVTATQPLIFEPDEIFELVTDKKKYFKKFDRVKLTPSLEPIHIDEFKKIAEEEIKKLNEKDFLLVLNTINASKEVFEHLNSIKLINTNLYYLSTNIIPKNRLDRIKEIKKDKKRKVIVSTQLIEAGVDIDVDVVFRDFAPLDSINQVAGRCNRNFCSNKKGQVKVFVLKNDNQKYYNYIYNVFLTNQTKEILKQYTSINENEFFVLSNEYFQKIKKLGQDDDSKKILANVVKLQFEDLNKFKLIEINYEKIDVFIEVDDNAKGIWQKYQRICEEKNWLKRKEKFLKIKKEFYDYVISLPIKYKNKVDYDDEKGIGHISLEEKDMYYNPNTGFMQEDAGGCRK